MTEKSGLSTRLAFTGYCRLDSDALHPCRQGVIAWLDLGNEIVGIEGGRA